MRATSPTLVFAGLVVAGCAFVPLSASADAQAKCAEVASTLNDGLLAGALPGRATVVGVVDTDVAGLKRISARASQRQVEQFAFEGIDLWKNRQPGDRAVACFIDTNDLDEELPFERIAIGYAFGDLADSWLPIDAGSRAEVPVVVP